jgi:pyrroloquinoline-quinone synthase
MDLFERIETVRSRWNVLQHPFYQRWSAGELTREELSFYAGEYRHAVVALADACETAAGAADESVRPGLSRHAAEERSHVELWDGFAAAVGAELDRAPREETAECARAWTAGSDLTEKLAVLYAIESAQPAISRTKLTGLVERYGFAAGPATAYFALHAELDREHAAHSRALIERLAGTEGLDTGRLVAAAEGALAGNWALLDGVERRFGREPGAPCCS